MGRKTLPKKDSKKRDKLEPSGDWVVQYPQVAGQRGIHTLLRSEPVMVEAL